MTLPEHPQTEQARARERWDNEGGHSTAPTPPHPDALQVHDWGGYRYSNPRDALAAAKRAAR